MNLKEMIAKFSEEAQLDSKLAKKILVKLEGKGLKLERFNTVLWKLQDYFKKNEYGKWLKNVKDSVVDTVIDQVLVEQLRMEARRNGSAEIYSEDDDFKVRSFQELSFSEGKKLKAGDRVEIQIMRTGKRDHPLYGKFAVTKSTLSEVIKHFDEDTRGVELAVDENHEKNHRALGWFKELFLKGKNELYASIELTEDGAKLLNGGAYKYFSPEIAFKRKDEETGKIQTNVLLGGAFTNRPFFKQMQPLQASEDGNVAIHEHIQEQDGNSSTYLFFECKKPMKKFLELLAKFAESTKITADQKAAFTAAFNELTADEKTTEITNQFNEIVGRFEEESEEGSEEEGGEGEGSEGTDPVVPTIKANEDGTVTMTAQQFSDMQSTLKNVVAFAKKARAEKLQSQVGSFCFSDSNNAGVILPKNKKSVEAFVLSLSEDQASSFFSILENLNTVSAGEYGHNQNGETVAASSQIGFFMEKMGLSEEDAKTAAGLID